MPAGRPTDYEAAYCEQVVAMGQEGASKAEMALRLGVARSTFDLWEHAHPEFSEAVKSAVMQAQGWWEYMGRKAVFGEVDGFNATAFIFNMKNRFKEDWRDKIEQEQSGSVEMVHKIERVIVRPQD